MNKFRQPSLAWRPMFLLLVAVLVLVFLFTFRLSTLTHGLLSADEAHIHSTYDSLHNIADNPLNAPYKLVDYAALAINSRSTVLARLTSVLFALVAITLFYVTLWRWHGRRGALLGTLLFVCSGWLLHVGRLGTTDIMFVLIPLSLLSLASWANATERHGLVLLYITIMSGLAFYTPGAIWFLLAGYILIHAAILRHIKGAQLWEKLCCIGVTLLLAGLLARAVWLAPSLLRSWLFLPTTFPAPFTIAKQLVESITFLFVRGPYYPGLWLAHMPLLDVFASMLCVIGGYFYLRHYKNLRSHILATFLLIGCALTALNGARGLGYEVPIVYLLVGTGLTYLLHKWLVVFPRNPLARGFGIGLITLAVASASIYHTASYFVAWRYNPNTATTFRTRP